MPDSPAPALPVLPLTEHAFAPYGDVIGGADAGGRAVNGGTSRRTEMPDPDLLADGGAVSLSVFRASACARPATAHALERHRLGSQTFVPLAGTPFMVVVALGEDRPDPATLRAFLADGTRGITLRRGVWHHPLMALADGDFVVLERRGAAVDCEVVPFPGGPARLDEPTP